MKFFFFFFLGVLPHCGWQSLCSAWIVERTLSPVWMYCTPSTHSPILYTLPPSAPPPPITLNSTPLPISFSIPHSQSSSPPTHPPITPHPIVNAPQSFVQAIPGKVEVGMCIYAVMTLSTAHPDSSSELEWDGMKGIHYLPQWQGSVRHYTVCKWPI